MRIKSTKILEVTHSVVVEKVILLIENNLIREEKELRNSVDQMPSEPLRNTEVDDNRTIFENRMKSGLKTSNQGHHVEGDSVDSQDKENDYDNTLLAIKKLQDLVLQDLGNEYFFYFCKIRLTRLTAKNSGNKEEAFLKPSDLIGLVD